VAPQRLHEIERLFHEAGERTPAERERFLARACADDSTLRREVESLLAQPPEGVIDAPFGALMAALVTPAAPVPSILRREDLSLRFGRGRQIFRQIQQSGTSSRTPVLLVRR
jgi:hypothetical protein